MRLRSTGPVRRGQPARAFFRPSDELKDLQALRVLPLTRCAPRSVNRNPAGATELITVAFAPPSSLPSMTLTGRANPFPRVLQEYWGVW